ncbi:MAG: DUF3473 domain-containing protein [Planctomycetota bacterium]
MTRPTHALTIDVEDWFQVLNLRSRIPRADWDGLPLRCDGPTRRILDLCDKHHAKATFFVLGWIAERLPDLVREITARGHEVGSHGWDHKLVPELGEEGFREETRRTRSLLEDLTGRPVESYRACTWSIGPDTPWALPTLVEEGVLYDSSIQPVRHPDYGTPDAPLGPHLLEPVAGRTLFELPPLVGRFLGRRVPLGGGGYLRLFPVAWLSRGLTRREARGEPSCLYLHPWELDPMQPRVGAKGLKSFRHYVGLARTEAKLETLLSKHRFRSLAEVGRSWLAAAGV